MCLPIHTARESRASAGRYAILNSMLAGVRNIGSAFVWTYIFGPFLAFLPQRWRLMWYGNRPVNWKRATIVSGLVEIIIGFAALGAWTAWETCRVGVAMGTGCGGGPFQFFALLLAAVHPVTWIKFYLLFEGFGRVFAAVMMDEAHGTAVLGIYLFIRDAFANAEPPIPDEVIEEVSNDGWKLRIESCRPRRDWKIGRRLFYKDRYYRIVGFSMKKGPRPYIFTLENLPAGVKTCSVILYSLDPAAPSSQSR